MRLEDEVVNKGGNRSQEALSADGEECRKAGPGVPWLGGPLGEERALLKVTGASWRCCDWIWESKSSQRQQAQAGSCLWSVLGSKRQERKPRERR